MVTPYEYWSCVDQDWVPWIAGDNAEAYRTEGEAERVAVTLAMQFPRLVGVIDVLRRA